MRAILVSVDYADYLAVTLLYNRHHFDEVCVVTSLQDEATAIVAEQNNAKVYRTDTFYEQGAIFNKWKSLEEAFNVFGRHSWICNMDADVLWPKQIPDLCLQTGFLYSPRRRMMPDFKGMIPLEKDWKSFRQFRDFEWAGYSQIFHCDDPHLGKPPWHQTNWKHAGGADSFFQRKWPPNRKIRPDFEVLHLGSAGTNWCGRATPYLDGTVPKERERRLRHLRQFFAARRKTRSYESERY